MSIKTIPLSQLTEHLAQTLTECADSGDPVIVELPDRRLVALQAVTSVDDDDLTDRLIASNAEFRDLLAQSAASPCVPFVPQFQP